MAVLEILGKVGFDWQVALANLVNFVIIFFILKRFAFEPIIKVINERKQNIEQGLKDAEEAKANLSDAEQLKNQMVQDAHVSANTLIAKAQQKGNTIISDSEKDAEKSKDRILKGAKEEIAHEKKKMGEALEHEFSELVLSGVEKVLKENLDQKQKQKMIETSLNNLEIRA